ncbi:MAG: hypothetical protein WDN29_05160 [Methylovirgula sp.]
MIAQALVICFTLLIGWASLMAIELAGDFYIGRFKIDLADNLLARKHVTQVRVLRRAAETVVMMIIIAVALMSIPQVRQFGVSLIASAGAAGIIVGLAARPVLAISLPVCRLRSRSPSASAMPSLSRTNGDGSRKLPALKSSSRSGIGGE